MRTSFSIRILVSNYVLDQTIDSPLLSITPAASQHEDKSHAVVSDLLKATFDDHYDLEIETRSLHGHKHFTTWEWTMIFIPGLGPDGQKLSKQESKPVKLLGCTLMWWNDKDKIVKNHEYMQPREL